MAWSAITLRERYGDLAAAPLIDRSRKQPDSLDAIGKQKICSMNFGSTPARMRIAIGWVNLPSAPIPRALTLSDTFYRMRKIPGIHIAFGHPYAEHTGADWISKTHIDCVGRDFDIWFDGAQVMRGGKFLV